MNIIKMFIKCVDSMHKTKMTEFAIYEIFTKKQTFNHLFQFSILKELVSVQPV